MVNKKVQYLILMFFFAALTAGPAASGETPDLDTCISRLEKRYAGMQDIRAAFKQETFLAAINRIERAGGEVYIKKGGRMFWDYQTPEAQQIILDNGTLWIYQPAEKQAMKNSFSPLSSHIVVDLFNGKLDIRQKFKVSLYPEAVVQKPGNRVLVLVPKTYDPTIRRLVLEVDPADFLIVRTVLEDELGTRTTLVFDGIRVNTGMTDAFFMFTPPPGVEVFSPPKL